MKAHLRKGMPFCHAKQENPDDVVVLFGKKPLKSWYCTLE
jgi:hypothetical protein